ncbi:MAG: ACP S-malonyltransferase [Erythrobacter sp.]
MAGKQRAVVIFPGRGSYASGELGYLQRHHSAQAAMIAALDKKRGQDGAVAAAKLDSLAKFSPSKHLPGRNASNLIYTCAQADFLAIDRQEIDVVAICGNSLGWYLSLAASGALSLEDGAHLVDTMGHMMERDGIGGQLLCPVADDNWQIDHDLKARILNAVTETENAFLSIDLGGTLVLAGDDAAIKQLQALLNPDDAHRFAVLPKHAAFHTPLLSDVAAAARDTLKQELFRPPTIPMIDGRGVIWSPDGSDMAALHNYTLGTQIVERYDFAKSIEVALKEFAPDMLILTGPGGSLGAPIAQCMITHRWRGMLSRNDFADQQKQAPFLVAMGREDQRGMAIAKP